MSASKGMQTALNTVRDESSAEYQRMVPVVTDTTTIGDFGAPILEYQITQNEFFTRLIKRIAYTKIMAMRYNSPLKVLEGDEIPLGHTGQEMYINPAKGHQFDVNDFAGLLKKYEADVKVQYTAINADLQYPVTVPRKKLVNAFASWDNLESFVNELVQSLYNGAYIDEYALTKGLISSAYKDNKAIVKVVDAITDEPSAKAFVKEARKLFLDFQAPSDKHNAWHLVGGEGKPVVTWTQPQDIVFVITNELRAQLDVDVLASAFNMDRTTLMGNIITVDNFDQYNEMGVKTFDGSDIYGIMCDRRWFRIAKQDEALDTFFNASNRTQNLYLNIVKMYNYSLFANGVIFAKKKSNLEITKLDYNDTPSVKLAVGEVEGLEINATPVNGTTPITYKVTAGEGFITMVPDAHNDRLIMVTGKSAGTSTITATAGAQSTTIDVTVE